MCCKLQVAETLQILANKKLSELCATKSARKYSQNINWFCGLHSRRQQCIRSSETEIARTGRENNSTLTSQRKIHSNTEPPRSGIVFDFPISFECAEDSNQQTNKMDILPSGNIFRELQDIYDTGYFSSQVSIEDQWQQASEISGVFLEIILFSVSDAWMRRKTRKLVMIRNRNVQHELIVCLPN